MHAPDVILRQNQRHPPVYPAVAVPAMARQAGGSPRWL